MEANEESYAGLLHCKLIITKHFLYNVIADETQSLNHIKASFLHLVQNFVTQTFSFSFLLAKQLEKRINVAKAFITNDLTIAI